MRIKKLLAASIIAGSFIFTPNICEYKTISVAHAEIQNYVGVGEYIGSDDETPAKAKQRAKEYAERNALEQAGVAILSYTSVENNIVTKDVIEIAAGGILNIIDVKNESLPIANESGYIKYRATVTAQIDTEKLDEAIKEFFKRDENSRSIILDQNESLKKTVNDLQKRIKELENQIENANTKQEKNKIKENFAEIDKDALFAQKLEAANKLNDNEKYIEAINLYNEAIEIKSNDSSAYFGRAYAQQSLKKYDSAIEDYKKATEIDPKNEKAYYNCGNAYFEMKNYVEAISNYNEAIKINPNYSTAYNNRGNAYYYLGDYEQAILDYDKTIEVNPNLSEVYFNRGSFYFEFEEYELAISDFNKYIEFEPNDPDGYYMRGQCYQKVGNLLKAQEDLKIIEQLGYEY